MNTSDIPILAGMRQKMQYLSERQALLAQNIANADTPNYKPHDIARPDFGKMVASSGGGLTMAKTDPQHLGSSSKQGAFKAITRNETAETNPNGNTVSLEEEIQLLSMNQMNYQEVATMYRKTLELFKTAIGRPGGA